MSFQISALPAETFSHLFGMTDDALKQCQARRSVVTETPGTPCRVSLMDAAVGETVILTNYTHQPADSPFRSSHAVYVRENAVQAKPKVNEVPALMQARVISLRYFNSEDMMIAADVVDGKDIGSHLLAAFEDPAIAYAHIHYAKPGCFAAVASRVA